jgi:hypothetical protein
MIHLTSHDESFGQDATEGDLYKWTRDSGSDPEHDLFFDVLKYFDLRPNNGATFPQCVSHDVYYSSETASEARVFLPETHSIEVGYLSHMARN